MKKIKNIKIGLIGGMGPFASAKFLSVFLNKIVAETGIRDAHQFPEILLDSIPIKDFISDTNTIQEAKEILSDRVLKLSNLGCTKIAMVCNTGHILFPELNKISGGKMISIVESMKNHIVKTKAKRIGILATPTTINTKLFQDAFEKTNIIVKSPNPVLLKLTEKSIRDAISGKLNTNKKQQLIKLTQNFIKNERLDCAILGCTELPLIFDHTKSNKIVDCLEILSNRLLEEIIDKNDVKI